MTEEKEMKKYSEIEIDAEENEIKLLDDDAEVIETFDVIDLLKDAGYELDVEDEDEKEKGKE